MDEQETIRVLEANLSRLLGWIVAAESRLSTVLAIDTAMLGVLAAMTPSPAAWNVAPAIFASLSALLLGASLLFLSFASFPRTSGPGGSLVYFGGIATHEPDQYQRLVSEMTANQYIQDLAHQCHRNAEIADKKFKWIKWAMASLLLSLIPWALSVYLLYTVRG
ncbi:MAG: Pycsar system effector family protein [Candidatus Methylomirabilales bacterium]